jgi:hypothetical protein
MGNVININSKRLPVEYTVHVRHFYDGTMEFWVEDIADDLPSKLAVADALKSFASLLESESDHKDTA